jgi:hypothetical protein
MTVPNSRVTGTVVIAKREYCGCPPGVVRACACHVAIAASVNQTMRLPRCHETASYSGQFLTWYRGFGIP